MKDVTDKVVAITGAAMGMGRKTADLFAADGAKLALLDLNEEKLNQAIDEINAAGGQAKGYLCDICDRQKVYEVFRQIEQEMGPVEVLFNNAGIACVGPLGEVPDDQLEKTIQVNLTAQMWTMKAVLPGMIERNQGHIINFASAAGIIGVPYAAAYSASKFGVIGLTESLRQELIHQGHKNIKFTIIQPSYVNTGMFAGVKPPLLSTWLEPETMARLIYKGFKKDKLNVRAPFIVKFLPLLRGISTVWFFDLLARVLRLRQAMTNWTGHEDN